MAKDRMREAAIKQISEVVHEVPEEHREAPAGQEKGTRTVRLVVRLDADEYRRLARYAQDKHLPVSTAARSLVMDAIRRG